MLEQSYLRRRVRDCGSIKVEARQRGFASPYGAGKPDSRLVVQACAKLGDAVGCVLAVLGGAQCYIRSS